MSPYGERNVHRKEGKVGGPNMWPPVALTTGRLKPIIHEASGGRVSITREGWVEIELKAKNRRIRISPDGLQVEICAISKPGQFSRYSLGELPLGFRPLYTYASEFVEVVRKKTPKVVVVEENGGTKAYLMENDPFNNFELHTHSGLKLMT